MNRNQILKSAAGIILFISLTMNASIAMAFDLMGVVGGDRDLTSSDVQKAADETKKETETAPSGGGTGTTPTETAKPPSMEQLEVAKYLRIQGAQTYLDPYKDTQQKMGVGFFIVKFIEILTKIIGSFALLVIIAGGITIMISTGNQNLQTKGKEMIKFAIMGLIVAFMSLIIVTFVQSLFYIY